MRSRTIFLMWFTLFVGTGAGAAIGAAIFPPAVTAEDELAHAYANAAIVGVCGEQIRLTCPFSHTRPIGQMPRANDTPTGCPPAHVHAVCRRRDAGHGVQQLAARGERVGAEVQVGFFGPVRNSL